MNTKNLVGGTRLLLLLMALIATILAGCGGGGGGDNGGGGTDTPPVITTQPQSLTVDVGDPASFTVAATGSGLSYQWQRQTAGTWNNVPNATGITYTIAAAAAGDAGAYRVLVSNAEGTATSNAATLTVATPDTGGGTVIVD